MSAAWQGNTPHRLSGPTPQPRYPIESTDHPPGTVRRAPMVGADAAPSAYGCRSETGNHGSKPSPEAISARLYTIACDMMGETLDWIFIQGHLFMRVPLRWAYVLVY